MKPRRDSAATSPQSGAVLAITLLILVVVTVLGVGSMSGSSVQMFLARNTQLKQISFQNAESAVLLGERIWSTEVNACLTDLASCDLDLSPAPIGNSISEMDTFLDSADSRVESLTNYQGKYVVEYLGWRDILGDDDKIAVIYRITSRATGPVSRAVTRVQTIYRKCMKTDGSPCPI